MEQLTSSVFLDDILATNEKVVLKFWAEWCSPCKSFAPVLDEVANESHDVKFLAIDVDKFPDIAQKYSIRGIPTTLLIHNKDIKDVMIGNRTKVEVLAALKTKLV